jgi:hypothetical protein
VTRTTARRNWRWKCLNSLKPSSITCSKKCDGRKKSVVIWATANRQYALVRNCFLHKINNTTHPLTGQTKA